VVPAKYSGKVSGGSLTGKLETNDDDLKCTYKLDKIDTPPSREWDMLKANTKLSGVVYQPYAFSFQITARKAGKIEGEITWPSIDNAKTKVKGTIEGDEFQFEETETVSKDVIVPVTYITKLVNKKMKGVFKHQEGTGPFDMDISK
jgi:hypothetical protein